MLIITYIFSILQSDNLVPDDRSTVLRYIIETLFIIHGETKLNMICPIGGDPEQRYGRPFDFVWCSDLYRHRST